MVKDLVDMALIIHLEASKVPIRHDLARYWPSGVKLRWFWNVIFGQENSIFVDRLILPLAENQNVKENFKLFSLDPPGIKISLKETLIIY